MINRGTSSSSGTCARHLLMVIENQGPGVQSRPPAMELVGDPAMDFSMLAS
jgi:hypothetical protein